MHVSMFVNADESYTSTVEAVNSAEDTYYVFTLVDGDLFKSRLNIFDDTGEVLLDMANNIFRSVSMEIKVELTDEKYKPFYGSVGSAGADLYAIKGGTLKAGERKLFSTGIKMAIPEGYVGIIHDRSGLALNNGLTTLGGVIDSDYRGEVGVILLNTGKEDINIEAGTRIAQIIISPYVKAEYVESNLDNTERGEDGFGSTGE